MQQSGFAMILVGVIFAGKQITDGDSAEAVGSAIGGGLFAMLTGGVSLFMAVVCLVGFAISYSIGREMKTEKIDTASLIKCPSCAGLIQKDAIKCRFCGDILAKS